MPSSSDRRPGNEADPHPALDPDPDAAAAGGRDALDALLERRFGRAFATPHDARGADRLAALAAHRSHRRFADRGVDGALLETLFGCAFSAPSKSDLQQACVVHVTRADLRAEIDALLGGSPWVARAPEMLVWCGDNRRIRRICELRGKPFANDHLDSFFNASVDCALAMMSFVHAAEAAGLGCCPLSAIRNHAARVSELLALPDHVFPVAGMVLGWPQSPGAIHPRLGLDAFVHRDRYDDAALAERIGEYDRRRAAREPVDASAQRLADRYGTADDYGWSEDKARQVSVCERGDFGAFIRGKGFRLD